MYSRVKNLDLGFQLTLAKHRAQSCKAGTDSARVLNVKVRFMNTCHVHVLKYPTTIVL